MSAPTSSLGPNGYPYKFEEVKSKLCLSSDKQEIPNFILSPSFLGVAFRDLLPLTPGVAIQIINPKDTDGISTLVTKVYDMMDCIATSKYDRPTSTERKTWTPTSHIECLLYQVAKNLAREGEVFYQPFQRGSLKNEPGRREAYNRLRGLVMLVCNVTVRHTLKSPAVVVRRIEAAHPAANPTLSPIQEVRVKWQLQNMNVEQLRKRVLDTERRGKEEKEWLIDILMGKEGGLRVEGALGETAEEVVVVGHKKVLQKDGSGTVASGGIKRSSGAVNEGTKTKAKTTLG